MPLLFSDIAGHESLIAVWDITEDLDFFLGHLQLSPQDLQFIASVHPRRALEWTAARMLIRRITGMPVSAICLNDEMGKPYLPGHPNRQISISHSAGRVAVAVSETPIGIDLQVDTPKLQRIAPKFLSDNEMAAIGIPMERAKIHMVWSAKEAMFKLYGKGQVDFRQHLSVKLPDAINSSGTFDGRISLPDLNKHCVFKYLYLDQYLLVYAQYSE